jgi:hypothetical protein
MKAVRLRHATCRNPEYDRRVNAQRKADGLPAIPHTLACRKGEVIEHPDAAQLCLGTDPALAPADDACRDAVVRLLNSPARKAELQRLKRMFEVRAQLSKEGRAYIEKLFGKYADELNGETPAQTATSKTKPVTT